MCIAKKIDRQTDIREFRASESRLPSTNQSAYGVNNVIKTRAKTDEQINHEMVRLRVREVSPEGGGKSMADIYMVGNT